MTEYATVHLKLSDRQVARLSKGEQVQIKHADLPSADDTQGVPACLTKTQLNRIVKAQAAGKGLRLKLSDAQIRACCEHKVGGSIWSRFRDFASSASSTAAPVAKDLATSLLDNYGDKAVGFATDQASKAVSSIIPSGVAGDLAKTLTNFGLQLGSKYASDQLRHVVDGIKQSKNGSGLFAPGTKGRGY